MPKFNVSYEFSQALPFDENRAKMNQRYQPILEGTHLKGIQFCEVEANSSAEAVATVQIELNSVLGFLSLHCGSMPQNCRFKIAEEITAEGAIPRPLQTSITLMATAFVNPPIIDFDWYSAHKDDDVVKAFGAYYVSCLVRSAGFLPESFLNFYLTLGMLEDEDRLKVDQRWKEYRFIRNGVAHSKISDDENRKWLAKTFGAEKPSWRDANVRNILSGFVSKIDGEVKSILLADNNK
jgi:hypothetical protein